MSAAPVFKETVAKVYNKKVAKEGFVFLIATAEVGNRKHTAYIQAPTIITAEERKVLFASLWNDLKPKVQGTVFKAKPVKEHRTQTKKIIAYAILATIAALILLSLLT